MGLPRLFLPILLALTALGILSGCSAGSAGSGQPVRREIEFGDRQKDWALVYYQSWRRAKDGFYLNLARNQMAQSIRTYFDIQVKIGHSWPDFYIVDRKRREGCRFLKEMDREAGKFQVILQSAEREGCLK